MKGGFLYRGVSEALDAKTGGKLVPKVQRPFLHEWTCDTTEITLDNDRVTMDPSEINAVHWHQASQKGYPTSGISTTPRKERARVYAKGVCGAQSGYIYTIARSELPKLEVREFVVRDFVVHPAIPEDDEVILVADGQWIIPTQAIIAKEKVE